MNIRMTAIATSLLVSSLFISPPVFAAATPTPKPSVTTQKTSPQTTGAMEQDIAVETKVDYTLPYPGILPDHPLYFLKRLRDQILERLIVDPIRKIEFYMLQSDKGINTGIFLLAKQSETLALETMTRARLYMEQAITMATTLKKEGKDVPAYLVERFAKAGTKYEELLMELADKASETQKANFMSLLESFRALQQQVESLKN